MPFEQSLGHGKEATKSYSTSKESIDFTFWVRVPYWIEAHRVGCMSRLALEDPTIVRCYL